MCSIVADESLVVNNKFLHSFWLDDGIQSEAMLEMVAQSIMTSSPEYK